MSRLGRKQAAQAEFEAGLANVTEETEAELTVAARLHSALGLQMRFRGAPEEAMVRLGHALKLARRTSNLELRCVCLVNWAAVLVDMRLLDRAQGCYVEALEVQERIGREEDAAISRINLAQVALEKGDTEKAETLAQAARGKLEASGTHWALPELYRIMAQLRMNQSRFDDAQNFALMAVSMGEQVENHYYVGGAHRLLGDLAIQQGNITEAAKHYAVARERLERVGEPRELARVVVRQHKLGMAHSSFDVAKAEADLKTMTKLMEPYPQDPVRFEIETLLNRISARGQK